MIYLEGYKEFSLAQLLFLHRLNFIYTSTQHEQQSKHTLYMYLELIETGSFTDTFELQWLEHLWDYENLFETGVVRPIEGLLYSQVRRHNRDIFSIFINMKVYRVFSLESPHRGDSYKYTQYTISQYEKRKIILNYPKSQLCALCQGTQERVRNSSGKRAISV